MEESLGKVFLNVPLGALNVLVFARALIRTAVAAGVALLLGVGVLGIGDAWAETAIVVINCPGEKEKKVKLKVSDDSVTFEVHGCVCDTSAEVLKQTIMLASIPGGGYSIGGQKIAQGQTITKTLYCYTMEQVQEILSGGN